MWNGSCKYVAVKINIINFSHFTTFFSVHPNYVAQAKTVDPDQQ